MSESPQQRASLLAPMPGDVIAQADIPDPAFAGGAMGVGFGVVPEENTVVAPVSGRITMVADTGHAVGFETADGLQVLLHLGVDTVELKGAPFRLVVAKGDTVQAGGPVGTMDLAAVEAAGKSTVAITVITNSKKRVESLDVRTGRAQAGDAVADALLKAAAPAAPAQAEAAPASSGGSKADLAEEAAMEAVLEESGLEPGSARAELTLRGDLDLDDLGLCAVVARFERAAGARCPDAEIEQWRTLGDLLSAARALGGG